MKSPTGSCSFYTLVTCCHQPVRVEGLLVSKCPGWNRSSCIWQRVWVSKFQKCPIHFTVGTSTVIHILCECANTTPGYLQWSVIYSTSHPCSCLSSMSFSFCSSCPAGICFTLVTHYLQQPALHLKPAQSAGFPLSEACGSFIPADWPTYVVNVHPDSQ